MGRSRVYEWVSEGRHANLCQFSVNECFQFLVLSILYSGPLTDVVTGKTCFFLVFLGFFVLLFSSFFFLSPHIRNGHE